MKNQEQLIEKLTAQIEKIKSIMSESGYNSDFNIDVFESDKRKHIGKQKFLRWIEDTSEIIKTNISSAEEKKLKACLNNMNIRVKMLNCLSYLEVLVSDIRDNPEKYKDAYKKYQKVDSISATLSCMHGEVIRNSKDKIQNRDYRNAILDTCIALETYVKKKASNMEDCGAKLMEKVFSPNSPIIRLSNETEEQKGFMFLFSGTMKAIRNNPAHSVDKRYTLEETLEILGLLSFLFRNVDK